MSLVVVTVTACGGSQPPGNPPDSGVQVPDASTGVPDGGSSDGGADGTDGGPEGQDGGIQPDGGSGQPDGGGTGQPDGGSGTSDGGTQLPDGGSGQPDGGSSGPNPDDPNNATKDTDCDGLSDQVEFLTDRGNGLKTNPGLADTDGDGLQDGLELGISQPVAGTSCTLPQDANPALKTNPVFPDTDGDGLLDGVEDANHNGAVEATETHPLLKDTDCDGLADGPTAGSVRGEDENANGHREASETNPLNRDTDGDGLTDGLERGVTVNVDPVACTGFVPDADPSTTTDAMQPDTDGDGVSDGAEDNNHNGRVDPPELDPNVSDATGPAGQVCTANNLRPFIVRSEEEPDLSLALPPSFTEVTQIRMGAEVKGLVGYDSTAKVTFLVFRRPAPAGATDPLGDEESLRPALASKGALSNRTAQLFTTWEGFSALQAFYDQSGSSTDLNQRTNELVDALLPGSTGRLSGGAGVQGAFRLQALYVHRSNQSLVVLVAITQLAAVTGGTSSQPAAFIARDLSGGSALAQFGEPRSVQCERFPSSLPAGKVDLLFVVDDSGSMGFSQQSLAIAAQTAVDALNASALDWRMAMVTSSYHAGTSANLGAFRRFTRNVNNVRAWLTQNSICQSNVCTGVPALPAASSCPGDGSQGANGGCWVGIAGSGTEGVLGSARKALNDITPGTDPGGVESPVLARADALLAVVLLGDADDQTSGYTTVLGNCGSGGTQDREGTGCEPVQNFMSFFGTTAGGSPPSNRTGRLIPVHGIVCPAGSFCGCTTSPCNGASSDREFNPQPANGGQRHAKVVAATGGVLGSILDVNSVGASMEAIIQDAISRGGYRTLRAPIGTSLKVAVDPVFNPAMCLSSDLPRSTANGFDFDGRARTLSLFGSCRPSNTSAQGAVSYQYWVDTRTDPNGAPPCQNDPNYSPTEPDHCTGPTLGCNSSGNQCVCNPNCGGFCGAGTACDMASCSCEPIIGR